MIRRYLFAGLFTLLPLVVTLWILKAIFDTLVDLYRPLITLWFQAMDLGTPPYWGLALIAAFSTVFLLFIVGVLVGNFVGRQLLRWLDEIMLRIPGVKSIYGAIKQLTLSIQGNQGGSFKDVVLVEWPHPGSYTLGFLAHTDCSWAMAEGGDFVAVYVPTAPNPTSGYVVMVPGDRVRRIDVGPDQALTWAVSGGVIVPRTGSPKAITR